MLQNTLWTAFPLGGRIRFFAHTESCQDFFFHTTLHLTGIPEDVNEYLDITKSLVHQIDTNLTPEYIFGEFLKDKKEMLNRINYHRRQVDDKLIQKLLNDIYFLRSDNYKLISYSNRMYELYDILNEPNEKTNLINTNNKKFKELNSILQTYIYNAKASSFQISLLLLRAILAAYAGA